MKISNPSQPSLRFKRRGLKENNQAFTLVELIVVITILAILGTIAFLSFQGYSRDARDSKRTSDINNLKTSLELYNVNTGKYPVPDSYTTITYSGGTEKVWYQGIAGDQVTTNLKQLNEKPLDPLTNSSYIYSVTNSYNEYEVLALYEGNVAQVSSLIRRGLGGGLVPYANAATTTLTPKIDGNYNGVFVKTKHYIIPVPSIVTSEDIAPGSGKELTTGLIKSLVMTNGTNIPKTAVSQTSTGGLSNLKLAVYTGSITLNTSSNEKLKLKALINDVYGSSTLSNKSTYSSILKQSTPKASVDLVNTMLLNGKTIPSKVKKTIGDCGTTVGQVIYGTVDGGSGSLSCLDDIMVCNGTTGSGYTIKACNMGQLIADETSLCVDAASCTVARAGKHYQFGRNTAYEDGAWIQGLSSYQWDWKSPGGTDSGSANDWGVYTTDNGNETYNNRTAIDKIKMQGPCPSGYHIPTRMEFRNLGRLDPGKHGWWYSQSGTLMMQELNIAPAGVIDGRNSILNQAGFGTNLHTSSPNVGIGFVFRIDNNGIGDYFSTNRSNASSIRCFKN